MRKLFLLPEIAFVCMAFVCSCTKENDFVDLPAETISAELRTTITGTVLDQNNLAVQGVTVTTYSNSVTTNPDGNFLLKDVKVNDKRCLIRFSKAGFMERIHAFIPSKRGVNYVKVVLTKHAITHSLAATSGGTVTLPEKASIVFQPNSFVTADGNAYTGSVSLAVNQLSPEMTNFGFMIPGGDLLGINTSGETVALYSYGMLEVELSGAGGVALQLAPGSTATLSMPIAASQQAGAPTTIPLWYFDDKTALWMEEGKATRNGNDYVGTVTHFSKWNCDYWGPRANIKGKVIDCGGAPLPNIVVTVDGWWHTNTDQNGEYQNWMPANWAAYDIQVLKKYNPNLYANSQVEIIPSLAAYQLYTVPDLVVPCDARVAGFLMDCQGKKTAASIRITGAGGYLSYLYTLDGSFTLPVPTGKLLSLKAYNEKYTKTQYITPIPTPGLQNLGNILVCDSLNLTAGNYFNLTAGSFKNQRFDISVSIWQAGINNVTGSMKPFANLAGVAAPDFNVALQVTLNDSLTGLTSCIMKCQFSDASNSYSIESLGTISCLLASQVGPVGTPMKGFYGGNIRMSQNGGPPVTGYMSGSFDVLRSE